MRKHNFGKKEILLALFSSLAILFVAELILRVVMPLVYKATKYGWDIPANSEYRQIVEDSPGKPVEIIVKYFDNGFKRWGDVHTEKVKMFIIGDSYTQMNLVSNGEEWYSFLEKEFGNLELFVYGGGGYGSLQEYMVLDDYIDKIKPDLIILQFFDNDFYDNLYELDLLSYPYNNHGVRPYLENGKIVYRQPLPLSVLRRYSFIANRILRIYDKVMWKIAARNLQAYQKRKEIRFKNLSKKEKEETRQLEKRAFKVTGKIMAMIRKRAGSVPVYFFNISTPGSSSGEKLCKKNNFIYIPGITECIISNENNYCIRVVNDGHWNKLGNKLVGEKLAEYFKKVGISKIHNPIAGINAN